eukprot:618554-Rhodomonas_salina.1
MADAREEEEEEEGAAEYSRSSRAKHALHCKLVRLWSGYGTARVEGVSGRRSRRQAAGDGRRAASMLAMRRSRGSRRRLISV